MQRWGRIRSLHFLVLPKGCDRSQCLQTLIAHWVKKAADQGAAVNFINQENSEYYFPIDNFILSGQEALAENLALVLKASNDDAVNKLPSHIEDVLNAFHTKIIRFF